MEREIAYRTSLRWADFGHCFEEDLSPKPFEKYLLGFLCHPEAPLPDKDPSEMIEEYGMNVANLHRKLNDLLKDGKLSSQPEIEKIKGILY